MTETKWKTEKQLTVTYFFPILRAHAITSCLRYTHVPSYSNCETVYTFKVSTIVTKNTFLHKGFLHLPLVIERIDLFLRLVLNDCQRNGKNIMFHMGKKFVQVFSAPWLNVWRPLRVRGGGVKTLATRMLLSMTKSRTTSALTWNK